jgi:pimeloyl-ACP methyl ester carboxylesterase
MDLLLLPGLICDRASWEPVLPHVAGLARANATDVLRNLDCPLLVPCGRADGWAPPVQSEQIAALAPGSRLAIIERCGHMAPMERPEAVGAEMAAWLRTAPHDEAKAVQWAS